MQSEMMMLPMMVAMGLTGSAIGYMLASSGSEYAILGDMMQELNFGHHDDLFYDGNYDDNFGLEGADTLVGL